VQPVRAAIYACCIGPHHPTIASTSTTGPSSASKDANRRIVLASLCPRSYRHHDLRLMLRPHAAAIGFLHSSLDPWRIYPSNIARKGQVIPRCANRTMQAHGSARERERSRETALSVGVSGQARGAWGDGMAGRARQRRCRADGSFNKKWPPGRNRSIV
jgi:hypothetical protein